MSHIIITGATGTAGAEALRQALLHPAIAKVTVLARRPLPPHIAPSPPDPKLEVVEHKDFLQYGPELLNKLKGADGVLWDLGISAIGFKEPEYQVITKDYAVAAAKAFSTIERDSSKGKFVFCYLSGHGTNQDESKAGQLFARVKGRAEVALADLRSTLPTLTTYSFRPAGIRPIHPVPEADWKQRVVYPKLFSLVSFFAKDLVVNTDVLAKGMLEVLLKGGSGEVEGWKGKGERGNENTFDTAEIKKLAGERE
ncbi:nucleoside-diphosphate-sugar epimerase [Meredithblackwellia eburnea MCA 4105]